MLTVWSWDADRELLIDRSPMKQHVTRETDDFSFHFTWIFEIKHTQYYSTSTGKL